jgi:hypothetical protein
MFQKTPLGWPLQLIETTQPEFEALGFRKQMIFDCRVERVGADDFSRC